MANGEDFRTHPFIQQPSYRSLQKGSGDASFLQALKHSPKTFKFCSVLAPWDVIGRRHQQVLRTLIISRYPILRTYGSLAILLQPKQIDRLISKLDMESMMGLRFQSCK